jgi:hypothetical protein
MCTHKENLSCHVEYSHNILPSSCGGNEKSLYFPSKKKIHFMNEARQRNLFKREKYENKKTKA